MLLKQIKIILSTDFFIRYTKHKSLQHIYFHRHVAKQTSTLYLNASVYFIVYYFESLQSDVKQNRDEKYDPKENIVEIHPSLEINQISQTLISRNRFVGNRRFDMLSNIYILSNKTSQFLFEPIYNIKAVKLFKRNKHVVIFSENFTDFVFSYFF